MAGANWAYNFDAWVDLNGGPGSIYNFLNVYPDGRSSHVMWPSHIPTTSAYYDTSGPGGVSTESAWAITYRPTGPSTQYAQRNFIPAEWPYYPQLQLGPDDGQNGEPPAGTIAWNQPVITVFEPGQWEKHFARPRLGALGDPGSSTGDEPPPEDLPVEGFAPGVDGVVELAPIFGRLVEERDSYGNRWIYSYTENGGDYVDGKPRIYAVHCLDRSGTLNARIEFDWIDDAGPLDGLVRRLRVLRPDPVARVLAGDESVEEVQRVEYYYYDDFASTEITEDSGQDDDLVEVRYYERVDAGPTPAGVSYPARLLVNQYRYHITPPDSPGNPDSPCGITNTTLYLESCPGEEEFPELTDGIIGRDHQLKMVIPSRHIENLAAEIASVTGNSIDLFEAAERIRKVDDVDDIDPFVGDTWTPSLVASKVVAPYASPANGGGVLCQLVRDGCGCSGVGKLTTYEYREYDSPDVYSQTTVCNEYFTEPTSGGLSEAVPFRTIFYDLGDIIDSSDPEPAHDGQGSIADGPNVPYRINMAIREGVKDQGVIVGSDGQAISNPRVWITHYVHDEQGRVVREMTPSAAKSYTFDQPPSLGEFPEPQYEAEQSDGLVYAYAYQDQPEITSRVTEIRLREGMGAPTGSLPTDLTPGADIDDYTLIQSTTYGTRGYFRDFVNPTFFHLPTSIKRLRVENPSRDINGFLDVDNEYEETKLRYKHYYHEFGGSPQLSAEDHPVFGISWTWIRNELEEVAENGPSSGSGESSMLLGMDTDGELRWLVQEQENGLALVTKRGYHDSTGSTSLLEVNASGQQTWWPAPGEDGDDTFVDDFFDTAGITGDTHASDLTLSFIVINDTLGRVVETRSPGDVRMYYRRTMETSSDFEPDLHRFTVTTFPHKYQGTPNGYGSYGFDGPASRSRYDSRGAILASEELQLSSMTLQTPITGYVHPVSSFSFVSGDPLSRTRIHRAYTGIVEQVETWHDTSSLQDGSYSTHYNYDPFGRLRVLRNDEGGIRRVSYDVLDRIVSIEDGTDLESVGDDGAAYLDQTETNGLTLTHEFEYDDAAGLSGNSNLVLARQHESGSVTRETDYSYDFRDRLTQVEPPLPPTTRLSYDNLSRIVLAETFDGDPATATRGRYIRTNYSQRGLPYKSEIAIDPALTTPTEFLEYNRWYDEAYRMRALWKPNGPMLKFEYDALNQLTHAAVTDRGGDAFPGVTNSYEDAISFSGDVVFEERQFFYTDDDQLPESTAVLKRDPSMLTSATGKLSDMTGSDAELVLSMFTSRYYDEANNLIRLVDHGTNVSSSDILEAHSQSDFQTSSYFPSLTPASPPTSASPPNGSRVSELHYIPRGVIGRIIDADEVISQYLYDDLYRVIGTVEGVQGASDEFEGDLVWDATGERWSVQNLPGGVPADHNRVTSFAYDGLSRVVKRVAHILTAGGGANEEVQETQYVYGVTPTDLPSGSGLETPNRLREVIFPDPATGLANPALSTRRYAYNRLGELTHAIDENDTEHAYERDPLGRIESDVATVASGSDIDTTIGALAYAYDDLGRLQTATSLTALGGTVINEIEREYDALWRLDKLHQRVDGAVRDGGGGLNASTQTVNYTYTTEAADDATANDGNLSRMWEMDYPSEISSIATYTVGFGGGTDPRERVSLVKGMRFGSDIVAYDWLGVSTPVKVDYLYPEIELDRSVWLEGSSPAQGSRIAGQYPGLDRFGRVRVDAWVDNGVTGLTTHATEPSVPSVPPIFAKQYTYTLASDLTAIDDIRPGPLELDRDRRMAYDGLHRLSEDLRGSAASPGLALSSHSSIEGAESQDWALDTLGNWQSFGVDADSDGAFAAATEIATRDHDARNQLDEIVPSLGANPLDFTNDNAGNLATREVQADGHVVTHHFIHDAWDRLVAIDISDHQVGGQTCTTPQRLVEQEHNALNHRTVKRVYELSKGDCVTAPSLTNEHHYYYDGAWRLLEEHVDPDPTVANDHTINQYFWGARYIDDAVMRRQLDATGTLISGTTHYYITDRQFSVVALMSESTSGNANLLERVSYTAYGEPRQSPLGDVDGDGEANGTASGDLSHVLAHWGDIDTVGYRASADVDRDGTVGSGDMAIVIAANGTASAAGELSLKGNIVGYAGYLYDAELAPARYTVRHRTYVPGLGRWAERDPLTYVDGYNLLQYVSSNPAKFIDPFGLNPGIDSRADAASRLAGLEPPPSNSEVMSRMMNGSSGGGMPSLDEVQLGLDALGMTPGVGIVPDLASGLLSLARGNFGDAGLSALAAVPLFGQPAGALKCARGAQKLSDTPEVGDSVRRIWGGRAGPDGQSWSRDSPNNMTRDNLGLPDKNSGEFMSHGRINNVDGVSTQKAVPADGRPGGGDEVIIPEGQVDLDAVTMPDVPR